MDITDDANTNSKKTITYNEDGTTIDHSDN
jgi:hypothetical protein